MRRVYDSEALRRDDDDPFSPTEEDDRSHSHVNWANLSHALLPQALRPRAIAVTVETDRESYAPGDPIQFGVTFYNRLPLPITVVTATPKRWEWSVDGNPEGSELPLEHPEERSPFRFDRSERKRFRRRWDQRVRVDEREWREAAPGEHTLAVEIDAVSGAEKLRAETTFRIER